MISLVIASLVTLVWVIASVRRGGGGYFAIFWRSVCLFTVIYIYFDLINSF